MEVKQPCILVLDDDELVRDLLCKSFERWGYAVVAAAEGRQGLEILNRQPVALAVIDIVMPGMGGIETLMEIHRAHPNLKTILISGKVDTDQEPLLRLTRQFGVRRVMSKPIELTELMDVVRELMAG